MLKKILQSLIVGGVFAMVGCASANNGPAETGDPLEPINRVIYDFNRWIDVRLIRPIAVTYNLVVPAPARNAVTRFFNNIDELPTTINALLQGGANRATNSITRFGINSTVGVAGLFDFATPLGYARDPATLAQTFYHWGWINTTYLVVPFVGPSTSRDFSSGLVSVYLTPWPYLNDELIEWSAVGLSSINMRAQYLTSEAVAQVAALDEYIFVRDAYLQNRISFFGGKTLEDTWTTDNEEWLFDDGAVGPN